MWRLIADFPPLGTSVAAVATFDGGFVAVGETAGTTTCDVENLDDGRIWTSGDGTSWTAADLDLANISMSDVVVAGGTIYAFGHEGEYDCEPNRQIVARSADGVSWRVDPIVLVGDTYQRDYAAVGNRLVAVGYSYDDDGRFLGSVWTSDDGVDWEIQPDSPESFETYGLAVRGDTVIFSGYAAQPIWLSSDGGVSWRSADYGPLYAVYPLLPAASGDGFAAVGQACCTTPNDGAGIGIWSRDGREWHEAEPIGTRRTADGIVGLPNGFVTIGRQSWLSSDGANWVIGPDIPGYEMNTELNEPMGAANSAIAIISNRDAAWVASVADLDATSYSDIARLAERPSVGSSYEFTAWTHCGWPAIHFDLRAWVPDPPIDDHNPPRGVREKDRGTLTFVSEDELRYDAQGGRVVKLVPSDEPTPSGLCA